MTQVWVRFDPSTDEAVLEDEHGNEPGDDLLVERDGRFILIGPIDLKEGA